MISGARCGQVEAQRCPTRCGICGETLRRGTWYYATQITKVRKYSALHGEGIPTGYHVDCLDRAIRVYLMEKLDAPRENNVQR